AVSVLVGDEPVCTIVEPAHCTTPGVGNGFTVTVAFTLQVFVHVYVTIDVPPDTPVTTPLDEPIVALVIVPLTHVPPASVLDSVVVVPWHNDIVPVIAAGNGITVAIAVLIQLPDDAVPV